MNGGYMSEGNGSTSIVAIIGVVVIIILLALYFYSDFAKKGTDTTVIKIETPSPTTPPDAR
jgi:hypothetical protein